MGAAKTTFSDIQVSVGPECQPARIVQARRENRDRRGAMVARSQLVGGRLAASHQPQRTGECDGEQHRQEPSHLAHLAPPFTRDRDLMCVRDAMRGEAFKDTTPRQSADATIRTSGHKVRWLSAAWTNGGRGEALTAVCGVMTH